MGIEKRENTAIEAARSAGKLLVEKFGSSISTREKADGSLVTDLDELAEREIVEIIRKSFPEDNIVSEENSFFKESEFSWIIDPLDGTHNYCRGIDIFGISIAIKRVEEIVCGIIFMPLTDELYTVRRGNGAFVNGKKIHVSEKPLSKATIIYDSRIRNEDDLRRLGKLSKNVFNLRMLGSTARMLSYVAEGKLDAEIEIYDKAWDFATGLLLIEEAGGKATDLEGNKWSDKTTRFVASNGLIHDDILRILNDSAG